jgi:hypothetical protein
MKIALIGNGKLSKNYGQDIDNSDIVIRFNRAKIKGYEITHGTKTDILSLAGETVLSYNNAVEKLDRNILKQIKRIFISTLKRNKNHERLLDKISGEAKIYRYINYDDYFKICKQIDNNFEMIKYPSTGINILCYCVNRYQDDDINVYGFDCFQSGHYFDDEKRNNWEFHDLGIEYKIIEYLKKYKNIRFFT